MQHNAYFFTFSSIYFISLLLKIFEMKTKPIKINICKKKTKIKKQKRMLKCKNSKKKKRKEKKTYSTK